MVNFRTIVALLAESVSQSSCDGSLVRWRRRRAAYDRRWRQGYVRGAGVDNNKNNNKPAKVDTKSCSEYYQGPLTRVALTNMAVRNATTRWDKDAVTTAATPTTDDDAAEGLPLRIWCGSFLLTVLCYLICLGTIPLIIFLSVWYTREKEELAANNNSTDSDGGGPSRPFLDGLSP